MGLFAGFICVSQCTFLGIVLFYKMGLSVASSRKVQVLIIADISGRLSVCWALCTFCLDLLKSSLLISEVGSIFILI